MNKLKINVGNLPPQAQDLEEAVLGAILLESSAIDTIADVLKSEMFYSLPNQQIFEAIIKLYNSSRPIDIMTVAHELKQTGNLESSGGNYAVAQLTNRVSSSANIEYHARIIAQKFVQRELIKSSTDTIQACYSDESDIFDTLSKCDLIRDEMLNKITVKKETTNADLLYSTLLELEKVSDNGEGITGVSSGIAAIDKITGGWQNSDLIIIAARPSMGKSSFVLSIALNAALYSKVPVAFFSLEMSNQQLMLKQMSINTGIALHKFRKRQLTDLDFQKIHFQADEISETKVFWDDTPGISVTELRAKCRKLKRRENIGLIVIDYLQLMTSGEKRGATNREQEISLISRSLKGLAKEINVPVLALSQLSRAVESRPGINGKKPILSDLRESGAIEQDADIVSFIYRPEYYGIDETESGLSTEGLAELIIAKHRNGAVDDVLMHFDKETTAFSDFKPIYAGNFSSNTDQSITTIGSGTPDF
jgi:replicative DNA helicase